MDRFNDPLTQSKLPTLASSWRSQRADPIEEFWGRKFDDERLETGGSEAPLVIRNPVHSRKLEEPIERKREYWSENLLYIMRREGLIPTNRKVVMDRPTPEEPYRLSANVVRLLEQEPQLYIAQSRIRIPSFNSDFSEATPPTSSDSWDQQPFQHSKLRHEGVHRQGSFEDSYHRPSHTCCDCGSEKQPSSFSAGDSMGLSHTFSSFSEYQSRHPLYGQSRHYSTSTASKIFLHT